MLRTFITTVIMTAAAAPTPASAQTTEGAPQQSSSRGAPATTPAKTLAPVAAGSEEMRRVPVPTEPPRTTMTGGNTNGGSN